MSPQRHKELPWEEYLESIGQQADIDAAQIEMARLSPRDMYEMASLTGAPLYLVNRPVNHAMHGTITNYNVDPVDVMKNVLIDGESFYKVDDWEHIRREEFVRRAEKDHFTGEVLSILVCYPISEGASYYWEKYILGPSVDELGNSGNCTYIQYKITTDDSEDTENKLVPDTITSLPYMPYVAITWNEGISIIDTVRTALIRLEASARVIAVENIERRGMSQWITGIDDPNKVRKAPRKFGRHVGILPTGAGVVSLSSDPASINLMTQEQEDLWESIEKATGCISVDKIASLSGISRLIAERPLVMLAEDIRTVFLKFLSSIHDLIAFQGAPEVECTFLSMDVPPGFDNAIQVIDFMDRALTAGAIEQDEWNAKARYLLSLGDKI